MKLISFPFLNLNYHEFMRFTLVSRLLDFLPGFLDSFIVFPLQQIKFQAFPFELHIVSSSSHLFL